MNLSATQGFLTSHTHPEGMAAICPSIEISWILFNACMLKHGDQFFAKRLGVMVLLLVGNVFLDSWSRWGTHGKGREQTMRSIRHAGEEVLATDGH